MTCHHRGAKRIGAESQGLVEFHSVCYHIGNVVAIVKANAKNFYAKVEKVLFYRNLDELEGVTL
jgi:hypothetical protein